LGIIKFMLDLPALMTPLQPVIDFLSQKFFGIPLVIHIIGFTHLAIMVGALFGQTVLEFVEKNFSKS
jgi:hypothetical protein